MRPLIMVMYLILTLLNHMVYSLCKDLQNMLINQHSLIVVLEASAFMTTIHSVSSILIGEDVVDSLSVVVKEMYSVVQQLLRADLSYPLISLRTLQHTLTMNLLLRNSVLMTSGRLLPQDPLQIMEQSQKERMLDLIMVMYLILTLLNHMVSIHSVVLLELRSNQHLPRLAQVSSPSLVYLRMNSNHTGEDVAELFFLVEKEMYSVAQQLLRVDPLYPLISLLTLRHTLITSLLLNCSLILTSVRSQQLDLQLITVQ